MKWAQEEVGLHILQHFGPINGPPLTRDLNMFL